MFVSSSFNTYVNLPEKNYKNFAPASVLAVQDGVIALANPCISPMPHTMVHSQVG